MKKILLQLYLGLGKFSKKEEHLTKWFGHVLILLCSHRWSRYSIKVKTEHKMLNSENNTIIALLGPTNTGKTHEAIEKMLEFKSGIFGFPLRLLAREVYEKCIKKIGMTELR